MNKKTDIKILVEQAMDSLDNTNRATPRPYLFTRVMASLRQPDVKSIWDRVTAFITRPAVALLGILLVAILNLVIISDRNSNTFINAESPEAPVYVTATSGSLYDFENQ